MKPGTREVFEPGIEPLTTNDGVLCVLAFDHRDALQNALARAGILDAGEDEMLALKRRILTGLASRASAVMLDSSSVANCRPPDIGLIVPLEAQGHVSVEGGRCNGLGDGFSVADARSLGADACKLLLYYRADHLASAFVQYELVRRVAANCRAAGLPLIVEPLVYRFPDEGDGYATSFPALVVQAVRAYKTAARTC